MAGLRFKQEALNNEAAWVSTMVSTARISQRLYPVTIHGVNRKVMGEDMRQVARTLVEQNRLVHPEMDIKNARWLRRVLAEGKEWTALVVRVQNETIANRMITEGVTEGYTRRMCEYFKRESVVVGTKSSGTRGQYTRARK
jgi:uncharacterized membrane protein